MNEKFEGMIGDGEHHHDGECGGPRGLDLAEGFGERAVKTGGDAAEDEFSFHSGKRGVEASRGVHGEEKCGAQERTENGGFPVPTMQKILDGIAKELEEGLPDGQWGGGGRGLHGAGNGGDVSLRGGEGHERAYNGLCYRLLRKDFSRFNFG